MFGAEPDLWQIELMEAVARGERRISVVSGHGVGKTTVLAWLIVWHILTHFPQKSVCTAPTSAQLFDALAAEVSAWCNKLPPLLQELIDVKTERVEFKGAPKESFASFRTSRPETPEALAGIHSDHVLLVADEASGIPEQVFEAAAGSMSGHNATTILAGNGVRSSGLFWETHNKNLGWYKIRVDCNDCARVAKTYIAEMAERFGEKSNAFRVRVLGLFPLADDDTLISFELMESALNRDVQPTNVREIWGVDCARKGLDRSALAKRKGNILKEPIKVYNQLDTMELVGRIKFEWDATPDHTRPEDICVDAIGIGAGVADRLKEMGLPARSINVSESPSTAELFGNLRAQLWWKMREWFERRDCSIANDAALGNEIIAVKYTHKSNGKLQIESKDDMKKRGMRSPDLADAFMLTFAVEAVTAAGGKVRASWKTALKRNIKGLV